MGLSVLCNPIIIICFLFAFFFVIMFMISFVATSGQSQNGMILRYTCNRLQLIVFVCRDYLHRPWSITNRQEVQHLKLIFCVFAESSDLSCKS